MTRFWQWRRRLGAAGLALALATGCRKPAGPPPEVVAAMNRGASLMGQYLYDDAVRAFEEAVKAAPGLSEGRIDLAIALFNRNRKEDLDAAGALLSEVLRREPENPRALYFHAIVLQHAGKAEQAIPLLRAVVRQFPEDGAAWYLLALCEQRTGQPAEAEFLRAVQCRPYLYSAYYQLYQGALRAGREAEGKQYLERFKALRESPLAESVELPQYNQMGPLALARPLRASAVPPIARSAYRVRPAVSIFGWPGGAGQESAGEAGLLSGAAAGDVDRDGFLDLVVPLGRPGRVVLLRQRPQRDFVDATRGSGLEQIENALACALGDFDNDDVADLCVVCENGIRLLKGQGKGVFADVTRQAGLGDATGGRSALFVDADHDGDLDLFVCGTLANQLWNNNGDGRFTDIAARAKADCAGGGSVLVLPGDLDGDRDMDLVILRQGRPAKLLLNELLGHYREAELPGLDIRGDAGGALQDLNGDGLLDLVVLGGDPTELALYLGDGRGHFRKDSAFAAAAESARSWGPLKGFRVSDVDLDGDLDLVCFGAAAHVLLNNGQGRFVLQAQVWKPSTGCALGSLEVADLNGDLVPDLLVVELGPTNRVTVAYGELTPPSTGLALLPTGIRSRDGRTRSPGSGYGVSLTARAGLREQRLFYTGQSGGANQSLAPAVLGLGGASTADYVDLVWPDGVAQSEMTLAAGQTHKIAELQRKVSSCPVLFAWNGARFEFVTDFAGVGGLGYYAAPGVSARPQVLEHVKIEPGQLRPRDGGYELRVTEPMEEAAYLDRLELLAVDHAEAQAVFPDERLAIDGPPPTHELLVVDQPIFPLRAVDPAGRDCTDNLARVDRVYAYEPPLDRRYIGFCAPHSLELDFGERLAGLERGGGVFLVLNGFIEYPYSQTVYAAAQSGVGWEPIRVERLGSDGQWETMVADGGAPGGMSRTMTIDLSGRIAPGTRRLRLTTNLEVYYDQVFVARQGSRRGVSVRTMPLAEATLRYRGFARERSPDGRLPLLYDYDLNDATAPFHRLKGAYTRYGSVKELLASYDDRFVLLGPGDELALKFDAAPLPPPAPGRTRSFVLVSHAYCKDMDLYTATPQTLEPLPYRGMRGYPYQPPEGYPDTPETRRSRAHYDTRIVE